MNDQATATSDLRSQLTLATVASRRSTIGAEIKRIAESRPEHPAIVFSAHAPLSYQKLVGVIDDVRSALRLGGFDRDARIAVALPTGPEAALAIVAVSCSAVSIPVNPRQSIQEIEASFAALRPDAVLVADSSDSDARKAAQRSGVRIIEAAISDWGTIRIGVEPKVDARLSDKVDEPDPNAPAFILQTSGTASEPKVIPFSHRNMLAAASRLQAWFELTPNDRCLSVSPPFYSHGLKVTVLTPLLTGGTACFPADASNFNYTEWFSNLAPTWYSAGPTLHRLIFDQTVSRGDAKTGHSLRFILSGGAPLPRNVLEGLQQAMNVPVVEHYGSSEAAQIAANLPGHLKIGTCGIPWPGTLRIVGDDGRLLPSGEQGEILVGGPTLTSGYLNAPELNRECFQDGWFKTGDLGSVDEDGFLTLHGRLNDVINRGGEKISPLEVDAALSSHPAIADAAAFSIPHSRLGEDVAAAVVVRPGMTVTPVELRMYLQDKLASYKIPRRISIQDQLPKGKTGKVLRRQLGELLEQGHPKNKEIRSPKSDDSVDKSTLVIQLTELWERLLQTKPISVDDEFFEKGGDSLLATEMLVELESLTGLTIPVSVLFEATTIRQLAQMLFELNIRPKQITKLNQNGSLVPIFLFHGDYNGGGLYAARLAKALGPDQPLFAIAPHDLGKEPVPLPIEEMAADALPLIRNAQPKGPYRLCGYCLGGLVAFEAARLLVAAGEKVEMVGMIDSPTVSARRFLQLSLSAIRYFRPVAINFVDRVIRRTWYICCQLDRPLDSFGLWSRKVARWRTDDRPASVASILTYAPKPVAVSVVYFSAEYGSAAWGRVSSSIKTVKIEADHAGVVREPDNLAVIARHLR